LHAVADAGQANLIALGAGFDLFLAGVAAPQAGEEAGLLVFLHGAFGEVDVVDAQAAVEVVDANVGGFQGAADAGPGTVKVGAKAEHGVAAAVFGQGHAARGVEVTRGEQGHGTTLFGAARHAGEHFIQQCSFQARAVGTARPTDVGGAAGRTGSGQDEDFAGIALHARLDAHTGTDFAVRLDATDAAAQATGQGTGELVEALPVGAEL